MWSWEAFFEYVRSPYLIGGGLLTIGLSFGSFLLASVVAIIVTTMRMSSNIVLTGLASFYTWLFRGIPLLVQMTIAFVGLPAVGIKLSPVTAALLALSLHLAAYQVEIIRGGLMSVPHGQLEAARALAMSNLQVYRQVIIPQAFRNIVPALGSEINGLIKHTSIASIIAVEELLRRSQVLGYEKFHVLEAFLAAAPESCH